MYGRAVFFFFFVWDSSISFSTYIAKQKSKDERGGGIPPEPLLSRAPLEGEGSPGGSLDADLVVGRGVERVFRLGRVVVGREEGVSGALVLGHAALWRIYQDHHQSEDGGGGGGGGDDDDDDLVVVGYLSSFRYPTAACHSVPYYKKCLY